MLAVRDRGLDGVEEADELLMAMPVHVAADHGSVEDVQRREERRRAMPLVVVGHGAGATLLQRQAGLGAVERLDLALLVDRQHDGVRRRVDVEPDHVTQLVDELRIVGELELPDPVRLEPVRAPDALDRADADAGRLRHHRGGPVGGLAPADRSASARPPAPPPPAPSGGMREGRVLSRSRPRQPSSAKRSCQRQTQVFDLPVRRMISTVPTPSALEQNDLGPPDVLLGGVAVADERLQAAAIGGRDVDGDSGAHAPDSHAIQLAGIPAGLHRQISSTRSA